MMLSPVNAKSYYEYLPSNEHKCGDIWRGLPSMGLIGARPTVIGMIVTPACDVANFKTETLTYLPIVPISTYLASVGFLPIYRREIIERLRSAGTSLEIDWFEPGYHPPSILSIEGEIDRLLVRCTKAGAGKGDHIARAISGLRLSISAGSSTLDQIDLRDAANLFGKKNWEQMKLQIITNCFRSDIHFIPRDEVHSDISGISEHSVILFRYPISVPSEILTTAQSCDPDLWADLLESHKSTTNAATHFSRSVPIKTLTLKENFLPDVLSRFTALFSRQGSPDFTAMAVQKMCKEIG